VRLAARLTGWKIDIISATEYEKEKAERDKEIKAALAEETEVLHQQEEAREQELKARAESEPDAG
jgi:N utilization substance protein A